MGERIILCSACGTRNRIAAGQRTVVCEGCKKPLSVKGGLLADLARIRWSVVFLLGLAAVIAVAYLREQSTNTPPGKSSTFAPDLPQIIPSTPVFAESPVYITPGLVKSPRNPSRAQLTLQTKAGANYYVKLVVPSTGAEVMSFYVRGGQSLTVNVPVGTYELKYAAGQTWYGPAHKFGPDTAYAKADEPFYFSVTRTAEGWSYSAWTVELILQRGGNLETTSIDASQF